MAQRSASTLKGGGEGSLAGRGSPAAAGGFAVRRECEAILAAKGVRELPPASGHVTSAGALPHKAVIHCVACDATHRSSPVYLRLLVKNALAAADAAGCRSVAMPVFATGHAKVKFDVAVSAMRDALAEAQTRVEEVLIVTNDRERAREARQLIE